MTLIHLLKTPRSFKTLFTKALLWVLLLPSAAFAQRQGLEIDIVGGNASALPIAVVTMPYQGTGAPPPTDVAEVVRADLARSGQFRPMPAGEMGAQRPTRGSEIDFGFWQQAKQNFVVVGRVLDAGDGGYRVEYELFDIARNRLLAFALTARANAMRDASTEPSTPPR